MATARLRTIAHNRDSKNSRWNEVLSGDKSGFEVCQVPRIGRGIRTTRAFKQNEVLMRYFGEVVTEKEAVRREKRGPKRGCFYRYTFHVDQQRYVLDATREDGTFGRLINHSKKNPNVLAKPVKIDGEPAIIFKAMVDIDPGVELRYDYGERDKEVLEENPWLKK